MSDLLFSESDRALLALVKRATEATNAALASGWKSEERKGQNISAALASVDVPDLVWALYVQDVMTTLVRRDRDRVDRENVHDPISYAAGMTSGFVLGISFQRLRADQA